MMNGSTPPKECGDVFALLSQYLDGELPDDLCARIGAHIEDCAPCVEFVESLRRARTLCRQFKSSERPSPLASELQAELRAALEQALTAGSK